MSVTPSDESNLLAGDTINVSSSNDDDDGLAAITEELDRIAMALVELELVLELVTVVELLLLRFGVVTTVIYSSSENKYDVKLKQERLKQCLK